MELCKMYSGGQVEIVWWVMYTFIYQTIGGTYGRGTGGFPGGSALKNPPANAGEACWHPYGTPASDRAGT